MDCITHTLPLAHILILAAIAVGAGFALGITAPAIVDSSKDHRNDD